MLEANAFGAGDEHFSDGDERIGNTRSSFSHTHTASYQQFLSRIYVEMIRPLQMVVLFLVRVFPQITDGWEGFIIMPLLLNHP